MLGLEGTLPLMNAANALAANVRDGMAIALDLHAKEYLPGFNVCRPCRLGFGVCRACVLCAWACVWVTV